VKRKLRTGGAESSLLWSNASSGLQGKHGAKGNENKRSPTKQTEGGKALTRRQGVVRWFETQEKVGQDPNSFKDELEKGLGQIRTKKGERVKKAAQERPLRTTKKATGKIKGSKKTR